MKNNTPFLSAFFLWVLGIFAIVSTQELIELLWAWYSYPKMLFFTMLIGGIWLLWQIGTSSDISYKIEAFLTRNGKQFFASISILLLLSILSAIYFWKYEMLMPLLTLLYIVSFIALILGISVKKYIIRSSFHERESFWMAVISYAIFLLVFWALMRSLGLDEVRISQYFVGFSVIYIVGIYSIFFHKTAPIKTQYISMGSAGLISALILFWVAGSSPLLLTQKKAEESQEQNISQNQNSEESGADEQPKPEEVEIIYVQKSIAELISIPAGLALWANWQDVLNLREALTLLGYLPVNSLSEAFDEELRLSLRDALIQECAWPESTQWIFGPQAKGCIDSLIVTVPQIPEEAATSESGALETLSGATNASGTILN